MQARVCNRIPDAICGSGGSGIAATRLTTDGALRLLINSLVTAAGLAVLIAVFIPASGAHFNPIVTAADWIFSRQTPHRYGLTLAAAAIVSQVLSAGLPWLMPCSPSQS